MLLVPRHANARLRAALRRVFEPPHDVRELAGPKLSRLASARQIDPKRPRTALEERACRLAVGAGATRADVAESGCAVQGGTGTSSRTQRHTPIDDAGPAVHYLDNPGCRNGPHGNNDAD